MTLYYVDGTRADDTGAGTSEATAKKTIAAGYALLAAGDTLYIKASATYTLTTTITLATSGSSAAGAITIEGYTTTPGARDGRPTITSATNSVALFTISGASFLRFRHLKLTHTAATRGVGILGGGAASTTNQQIFDCLIDGCFSGIDGSSRVIAGSLMQTTVQNCISDGVANDTFALVDSCAFRANGRDGFRVNISAAVITFRRCLFVGNTGRGFYDVTTIRPQSYLFLSNSFRDNLSDGIRCDATSGSVVLGLMDCDFWGNGGWGVSIPNLTTIADDTRCLINMNNAYGSNTSGNRNHLSAGDGDLTLTASPSANAAGLDWGPNTTAGGGAVIRGIARAYPGLSTTSYADVGSVQHADPVGSSGGKKRTPQ